MVNFQTWIKTFQALTTLVKEFPKQMAPHLMDILPHMWNTLTQSADRYVRTVVNYTDDADDPVDSDGKKHNYFKLSTQGCRSHIVASDMVYLPTFLHL